QFGTGAAALRPVRPDLRRSTLCRWFGNRSRRVSHRRRLAQFRRLDERRDQPQRRRRAGRAGNRSDARHRPRPAYFVAPPLAFDAFRISSISTVSLRPTAAAAAFPASFTARPARLLVVPSSRARLLKPCSASAARAAVAATATSSAANGLCSSLMNASPVVSDERRPPPLLRRSPTARDFGALLARALGLPADFVLPVAFLAIFYLLCLAFDD